MYSMLMTQVNKLASGTCSKNLLVLFEAIFLVQVSSSLKYWRQNKMADYEKKKLQLQYMFNFTNKALIH